MLRRQYRLPGDDDYTSGPTSQAKPTQSGQGRDHPWACPVQRQGPGLFESIVRLAGILPAEHRPGPAMKVGRLL